MPRRLTARLSRTQAGGEFAHAKLTTGRGVGSMQWLGAARGLISSGTSRFR
jgi:hypothetical protein